MRKTIGDSDLVIYFTRYFHNKLIKILRLHYDELIGNIEEHERKKYLIVDYVLGRVLGKIKRIISIKKFDDAKILINADDKLPDNEYLKKCYDINDCFIKDDG